MIHIWVIYAKPTDYPDAPFVIREHHIKNGTVTPTSNVVTGASIEEVRETLPPRLTRMPRADDDEPQIVEWWYDAPRRRARSL